MHFNIIMLLTSVMKNRHSVSHRTNAIALCLWKLKVITRNFVLSKKWDMVFVYESNTVLYTFLHFGE